MLTDCTEISPAMKLAPLLSISLSQRNSIRYSAARTACSEELTPIESVTSAGPVALTQQMQPHLL